MKSRDGKSQRRKSKEKVREEKINETKVRESQKEEDPGARKGRQVAKHCFSAAPAGQMRDDKLHTVVVRSTFPSHNVCAKHTNVGPLLEVEMSKKCTPLWHEVDFQVRTLHTCSGHFWMLRN